MFFSELFSILGRELLPNFFLQKITLPILQGKTVQILDLDSDSFFKVKHFLSHDLHTRGQ